jgi:hypothetical protein
MSMSNTTVLAREILCGFVGTHQQFALKLGLCGEENAFFSSLIDRLQKRIADMPKTYEQEGKGDDAIVYLHYFRGGADWYITEKDKEARQLQAFGLADLGYGSELGYISIVDLVRLNVELDLHFEPKTLGEIKKARGQ